VALERPDEEAQTRCRALSGVALGRARLQTWVHQAAAGRTVLEVAPAWEERARRMAALAPGRWRRPVVGLGRDGADGPTRPASARERHAGPRPARARRASWHGQGRAATGVRFARSDDERLGHLLRGPQGQTAAHLGAALQPVTEAGGMPHEQGRLWVVGEGASWRWQHVQALFPRARHGLDASHGKASLHQGAKVQEAAAARAVAGGDATVTRLSLGQGGGGLGGVRRRQPASEEALKALDHCGGYLQDQRDRTHEGQVRRGGSPLGRGGRASAHTFLCPGRRKRSGAWGDACNGHARLARRCATYHGTFARVFERHRQRLRKA